MLEPNGLERRRVGRHYGDVQLDGRDDDHLAEDVGKVWVNCELMEDDDAEAGDNDCDAADRNDGDDA